MRTLRAPMLLWSLLIVVSSLSAAERIPPMDLEVPPLDAEHGLLAEALKQVVHYPKGVDYYALREDPAFLEGYLAQLATAEIPDDRAGKLALWINAYNATTLALVIRTLPPPGDDAAAAWADYSVMTSVEDFWTAYHFKVAGEWLSIDAMQKEKLAALDEPRIHFAINCASVSCPPLLAEPYTAAKLEQQLDRVTRAFVADDIHVAIEKTGWGGRGRSVTLNPIMQWYRDDFGGSDDGVRKFLARHADGERAKDLARAELSYGEYDWDLNSIFPDL